MTTSLLGRVVRKWGSNSFFARLTEQQRVDLQYLWPAWARSDQLAPSGSWRIWFIMGGKGSGKTRSGAEWIRDLAESGRARSIALVAKSSADARDVMVEKGPSSLMEISRPEFRPLYESSKRRLTWPNGAVATCYSADEPDQLRGPQHDAAWADEIAAWKQSRETWDNLMMGLRVTGPAGDPPRVVATTTPRPIDVVLELAKGIVQPNGTRKPRGDVIVTGASTFDNEPNLAPEFITEMRMRYEGTRLGRQELKGELLEDVEGALWTQAVIDDHRTQHDDVPELAQLVVAIDPAVSAHKGSSETGIVMAGADGVGHVYVGPDLSGRLKPGAWAKRAIDAYHEYEADEIIGESNQGGELVRHTLRTVDTKVPIRLVHASRGKRTRAEPVAAMYEQGRVHHVGILPRLEDQLTSWIPGATSPDRLDAMVWAITALNRRAATPRVGLRIVGGE